MAKLTLSSLTSSYRSNAALNANFDAIEAAIENTLSRDGTSPNAMAANLDMGSNRVVNLAAPVDDNDAIRKVDVDSGIGPEITTVADNITSVTTVATNISDVTAVSADLTGADTIGDASALLAITAPGIVAKDTGGSPVSRTITGSTGISVSNGDGGAGNPTISLDAELVDIAGITPVDGTFIVGDGSDFVGETGDTALTSLGGGTTGIAVFKGSSAGAIRTTLSLTPGTDVLVYDANLQTFVDAFTLPTTDGLSGQALTTDGLGNVSWTTPAGGGDTLAADDETITGSWTFNSGLTIGSVVWPNVSSSRTGAENLAAIQDAIDNNPSGTVINLPGESFTISGGVNLRGSLNNKINTIIQGPGPRPTVINVDDATGASGEWANGGSGYVVQNITLVYPTLPTFPYIFSSKGLTSSTDVAIDNAGGYSIGATTLDIDGTALVGSVSPGDRVEFTGHAQPYIIQNVVTASGNALTGVQIYPALTSSVSDNQTAFIKQVAGYYGIGDGTSNALIPSGTSSLRLHFNLMETTRIANPEPAVGDQFFLISENNPNDSSNFQNTVPYRIASVGTLVGSYTAASYWPITVEHWNGSAWVSGLSTDQPNGIMTTNLQDYRNNLYNGLALHHCDFVTIRNVWVKNARLHGISVGSSTISAPNAYRTLGSGSLVRSKHITIENCLVGQEDDPTETHVQGSLISGANVNHVDISGCQGFGNLADTTPSGNNWNYGIFFEKFTDLSTINCYMARCLEGYRFTNFSGLTATHWSSVDCRNGFVQDQNGRGYTVSNFNVYSQDYASLTQIGVWARTGEILTGVANDERDASGTIANGIIKGIGSASYGVNIGCYLEGANTVSNDSDDIGFMSLSGVQVLECYNRGFQFEELRKAVVTNCIANYNGGAGLVDLNTTDVTLANILLYDNCQDRDNAGLQVDNKTGGILDGIQSKNLRDATAAQDYGVEWLNTSSGVRIGLNNEFRGDTDNETGTRPTMKATILGDLEMQTEASTGTFSDAYKMVGLDANGDRVAYAGLRGSVRNNSAGNHRGRLYFSIATGGTLNNNHYIDDDGLTLVGDVVAVDGTFSGNLGAVGGTFSGAITGASVSVTGQVQGQSARFETASGEATLDAVTGSSTGNLSGWTSKGDNSAAAEVDYARLRCGVRSNAAGNHAGRWLFQVAQGGALTDMLSIENGIVVPGSAGLANDRGRGSVDIDDVYYVQGTQVVGSQQSAIASLTNSTGGTTDGTLAAVTDTSASDQSGPVNDNFAEVNAKVDAILSALRTHGLIAT